MDCTARYLYPRIVTPKIRRTYRDMFLDIHDSDGNNLRSVTKICRSVESLRSCKSLAWFQCAYPYKIRPASESPDQNDDAREEMPDDQFLLELELLTKLCFAQEAPARPMKQHSFSKTSEPAPPPMRYKKPKSSQIMAGSAT